MGLLSIFKRRADAAASEPVDAVQRARVRARQRLIGAVVLVIVGIIGFPLVFETQPRPIPVDIPIEVPRKEGAPPLVMPARAPATTPAPSSAALAATDPPAAPNDMITESREEAGRDVDVAPVPMPAKPEAKSSSRPETQPEARPEPKAPIKPPAATAGSKPEPKPEAKATPADAARARDLLEGKPAPATAAVAGRFVVQVGAFADAAAAQETRLKVEKLGLKTYTQVAGTSSGNRIRVRVGPFGSRDEADKALAKARGAGLTAVVLTL